MADIFEAIREAGRKNPKGDADDLAKQIVAKFTKSALVPLVARELQHYQRACVRLVEMTTFRARMRGLDADRKDHQSSNQPVFTPKLLSLTFSLGDGSPSIRWGEATAEQHRLRIAMMEKQRDGINQTIDRHVAAISEIERYGVTCLDEIAQEAA